MARSKKPTKAARSSKRNSWERISKARLEALVAEATVDAYGKCEQGTGLFTMIEDHLALPFRTQVLGVEVTVVKVDLNDCDDVVAICKRGRERQALSILDLPLPNPRPDGWEWIEAFRYWARGGRVA
jgi:hypothetical protein